MHHINNSDLFVAMGDAQASNAGAGAGAGDTTSAEGPIVYDTSENAYEEEEEEYEDEDDMDMESESSSDDEDCEPFIDPATINTLSQAEREWALQIKAAVEEESSLHNLSDSRMPNWPWSSTEATWPTP